MNVAPQPPMRSITADQRLAAIELVARMEAAIDRRDAAELATLFTDNGRITGLMQTLPGEVGDSIGGDYDEPPLAHLTANHVVSASGSTGLQIDYLLLVLAVEGTVPRLARINHITDELVDTVNGLRVHRHDVQPFGAQRGE